MKTVLLFLLMPFCTKAQFLTKKEIIQTSLVFASGFTSGIEETLKFNYKGFKAVHPGVNDQFWNPKYSWVNKYEDYVRGNKNEAYFLSKTALVWTTDGYHLTRFASNTMVFTALAISAADLKGLKGKKLLMVIGKRILLYSIARGLGQYCSYKLIYEKSY
jgi:hypothetical protein